MQFYEQAVKPDVATLPEVVSEFERLHNFRTSFPALIMWDSELFYSYSVIHSGRSLINCASADI